MTVKSWTEFRYIVDGVVLLRFDSEKDARDWAKRIRDVDPNKNPDLKYVIKEVSICEAPRRKFLV